MQTRVALGIVALAIVGAGGWIWYARTHVQEPTGLVANEFTWTFIDRGVNASSSVPMTDVGLRIAGVEVPLGTFDGTCTAIAGSAWPLLSGELSGAICYWAGSGTEIGVFQEGSKLVLKQGDVSEGDAQHPGARTNFVALKKQPQL